MTEPTHPCSFCGGQATHESGLIRGERSCCKCARCGPTVPAAAFGVDVNAVHDRGIVGTTRGSRVDSGDTPVGLGSLVWATDADNKTCVALVTAIDHDWLELQLFESTWERRS